jgi:hypothetical protein
MPTAHPQALGNPFSIAPPSFRKQNGGDLPSRRYDEKRG